MYQPDVWQAVGSTLLALLGVGLWVAVDRICVKRCRISDALATWIDNERLFVEIWPDEATDDRRIARLDRAETRLIARRRGDRIWCLASKIVAFVLFLGAVAGLLMA
jgi:hypothetical protein